MYFFSLNSKSLQRNISRNYMIIKIIINYNGFNIFLHLIFFNLFQECKQLYRMNNVKKMLKKLFFTTRFKCMSSCASIMAYVNKIIIRGNEY